MHVFDGFALFFFILLGLLNEARVVFTDGVNKAFVLLNFMAMEGVGFGHSSEYNLPFFLFFVMNGSQLIDMLDFVVDDGLELMNDFM